MVKFYRKNGFEIEISFCIDEYKFYNKECRKCLKCIKKMNHTHINYFYNEWNNGRKTENYKYTLLISPETIEEANLIDDIEDCYRAGSNEIDWLEMEIIEMLEDFSKEAERYLRNGYDSLGNLYYKLIDDPIWKKARTNLVALNILKNNKLICDKCKKEIKRGKNGEMYDLHHKEYVKGELFNPEYAVILHHKCHQNINKIIKKLKGL